MLCGRHDAKRKSEIGISLNTGMFTGFENDVLSDPPVAQAGQRVFWAECHQCDMMKYILRVTLEGFLTDTKNVRKELGIHINAV